MKFNEKILLLYTVTDYGDFFKLCVNLLSGVK